MGSSVNSCKDLHQLVGLRVVRGPDWDYDTQDGGEGCIGTVVAVVGNAQNPRNVEVRWDSGERFVYRVGAEDAHDLRVLDNSTVGIKHSGVKCEGCEQEDIAGLRWQCLHCSKLPNLCTFCFTNEKHDEKHVDFRRYDKPSSDPIVVHLDDKKPKIQLNGFFPGALVRRGKDWKFDDEDGRPRASNSSFYSTFPTGKVVPSPNGHHGGTPGKVWVQWPHKKDKSYSYRVGFNGQMDLKIARAGVGGRYQPHTLPILKISKPKLDEKTNDVDVLPLVKGDMVKLKVGLEELREIVVDCRLRWNPSKMEKVVNEVGEVEKVDKEDNTVRVQFPYIDIRRWIPEKALKRLIPWLPVDSVVQVCNGPNMGGNFGRVKKVNSDGTTAEIEFLESGENRTIPVSQLKNKLVDTSLVRKMESIRKEFAGLLVMEDKGAAFSVEYLLQNFLNMVDCRISYKNNYCTALSVACQIGNLEIVKLLLQYKASVDMEDEEKVDEDEDDEDEDDEDEDDEDEDDEDDDERCNRPIHHAVLGNHPEILKHLLENGASPNHENENGVTPLHFAAQYGYVECLKLLLEDERCDLNNSTAFTIAVESPVQSLEILKLLHDAAIKLNITEKHFNAGIFFLERSKNNIKAANFMLNNCQEGKIFAKQIDFNGDTTLNWACKLGHYQIAKLLVSQVEKDENGKPIDRPNNYGVTPLMIVILKGNYELIEFLIEAGANLQATDKKGDTPFHYAAHLFRENKKSYLINWPNEKTAPQITKHYNELKTKRPDDNLCPSAAIVYYLALKEGIPLNLTRSAIKKLVGDDFLYDEMIKFIPSQSQELSNEIHGRPNNPQELAGLFINADEIARQPHLSSYHTIIHPPKNLPDSLLTTEEEEIATKTSHKKQPSQNAMAIGDHNNSITQKQQPLPSSLQQSETFNSIEPIMANPNFPLTMAPKTDAKTSTILPTSSDNNILEQTDEPEQNMSVMRSFPHVTTVDTSIIDPTKAGTLVTCRIEEKKKSIRKKDGSEIEIISWILIDDQNRRYSQQKKSVSHIFQCTANVSIQNKNKKCKGSIRIPVSDLPKLEELKEDFRKLKVELKKHPQKTCTFTVGNTHEEHLPSKRGRGRQSTDTESEISSTSVKRKRKT